MFVAALGPLAIWTVTAAQAIPGCDALATTKQRVYGFHPSQLSAAEQKTKGAELDQFWDAVKAAGPVGLSCVAKLVADEKTDTFFLFDAASLLSTFDTSGASDPAIVSGLSRADLADLDPAGFIDVALKVSRRGGDVGQAAHNYMNAPKVTAYLPAHGNFTLDRISGAILLYGRMPADLVDKYLAIEVTSTNPETRDAAAIVWSFNMTEASFKGIAALGEMKEFSAQVRDHVGTVRRYTQVPVTKPPRYTREQMLDKIAKWPDFTGDPNESDALDNAFDTTLTIDDLETVREARRRVITGVSNEAVDSYVEVSRMLMNLVNVLDAYKSYRIH